jgi:cell division septation protein DedD
VGSFKELDNALHLKSGLELKYKEVYIIAAEIKKTTYYRVRVGKFPRKEEAFGLAKTLADEGYSPLVTHYDERA